MKRRSRRYLIWGACAAAGFVIGWRRGRPDPLEGMCQTGRCPR